MKVRYVNYPLQFCNQEAEIMGTLHTLLSNGDLMLRQQLRDFEANLAAFVGCKHGIGTSNCTDALHLSLRAAGVGPGDEVISVSHTFVATIAAIHHTGATPVLVDIGLDHNIDPELIEPAITPRTKAIVPVSLNGRTCAMDRVMEIAEARGLTVIEDSAQALGGSILGRKAGAWGLAGCFSFYPAKLLGAYGDGGAVTTNSDAMAEQLRSLRDHGRMPSGDLAGWSFNCRLDNIQAALLDLKLRRLPEWLEQRRRVAGWYEEKLSGVAEITLPPGPNSEPGRYDVYQNYEIEADRRDELVAHLRESGIEVMIPWGGRAVHQFRALDLAGFHLPRTDALFRRVLMLPMYPELLEDEVDFVCRSVRRFYGRP